MVWGFSLDLGSRIEAIVDEHHDRYVALKRATEEKDYKTRIDWFTVGASKKQRRYAEWENATDESLDSGSLPKWNFYKTYIVSNALKLARKHAKPNSLEFVQYFEGYSSFYLDIIETMCEPIVCQGANRKHMIARVLGSYFSTWHEKPRQVVLGLAKAQTERINLHAGDGDYPYKSYQVEEFFKAFENPTLKPYCGDFAELLGNINNGHTGGEFMIGIPSLVKELSKSPEIIPAYLYLADIQRFPGRSDYFNFMYSDSISWLKQLSGLDKTFPYAVRLFGEVIKSESGGGRYDSELFTKSLFSLNELLSDSDLIEVIEVAIIKATTDDDPIEYLDSLVKSLTACYAKQLAESPRAELESSPASNMLLATGTSFR